MKKVLSIALAIVMLFTLIGTTAIVSAQTTYNIVDSKDYIRPIGRYEWVENGLACDWTATGFEFTADVEGDVSVTMTASCPDVGSKGSWNADGYLTVYIDGVRQNYRVRYISGTLTVNIAEDVADGVHTFKVVKQNDFGNKVVFTSVNFSGTFGEKPQEKEVIEFVGDSITAGFGSLDNPSNGAARYSDGTRTWNFIIAENFGMDARVIARSGGTIYSEYTDYTTNLRAGGSYDYSLKKPKAVVLSFGTNDGVQSVSYWKSAIKQFADAIRTGYNDVNIPIVMVTNLMSNDEKVRENIANAIFSLQEDDATAYANIYNIFGITNAGGHPNQAEHLKNANRITRELVELGIMGAAELRDDATITLTENTVAESVVNSCDKAVSIGKPSYTATEKYSGITSETVDPIDPADIGSETAKANKFTADGTQEETTDYRFTKAWFGGFNKPASTTKGISFYINYKDTDYTGAEDETYTRPYILLASGDKMAKVQIPGTSVETDGKTMKVELYWNTMPSVSYVFLMLCSDVTMNISIDLDGKCEYIIDNIKTINSTYQYADNANKAYTYTTGYDSYPLMGVTDNYGVVTTVTSATTTTTTTPSETSSNLALGKSTVSCELESSSHAASEAVDGKNAADTNNRWASAYVDNAWWVVDLGDVYDVNTIKIYWEGAYSKEYKIQVATDEATWTDVSSKNLTKNAKDETYWTTIYTGGTSSAGLQEIAIAEENQARYVCFQGVKRGTSYGNSFYEFEVYGTKATIAPEESSTTTTTTTTVAPTVPEVSGNSVMLHDVDIHDRNGTAGMWGDPALTEFNGRKGLKLNRGDYMSCGGVAISDANIEKTFADYADSAIGVRFWAAAATDTVSNKLRVYIGASSNPYDGYTSHTLVGETETLPNTTWTQYTVMFNEKATPEKIASITHIFFTTQEKKVAHYIDDIELLLKETTPAEQDGETTDLISTDDGASIRLNEVNGMRFYATVNGDISNATEVGIIIAPKDKVQGEYFTTEDDHIKVVYDHKDNALWDGNKIVGSIVNVKDGNLARDFIARAYVVIDGVTYYAKETTVRNLAGVADAYIADAKGGYAELDADKKALVDAWASKND